MRGSFDAVLTAQSGLPDRVALSYLAVRSAWSSICSAAWLVVQCGAVLWHRLEHRRLLSGPLSDEQIAALVAASWSGPARYVVTQERHAIKARRTVRQAERVFRVSRKIERAA